jgi:hypothetical protein
VKFFELTRKNVYGENIYANSHPIKAAYSGRKERRMGI